MSTDRPAPHGDRFPVSRLVLIGCYVGLLLAQLLQLGTLTTFDTKLDLLVDPGRFLAENLSLWSPRLAMGSLQNQAYGYLLPIGPVFWAAHALALPAWLTERLWSAGLSILAFEGARRIARAWGGPRSAGLGWRGALVVGAGYVCAPRFLSEIGVLSGELLPTVLLPWALLPLLRARRGRTGWPLAVALSGLAVALMGGVNAAEVIGVLPLPVALIVSGALRGELPWRALAGWCGAVIAGCAWWLGPLVLLGRYSPPFLDFVESAANTTRVLGWVNATRGADNWVGYVAVGGRAWWPAGFALDTVPWLILVTALVAAVSLCGLLGPAVRDRPALLVCLGLGLVCLVAGHGGGAGGLFAAQVRGLLDGPFAALRNVHKVDPLIRLPMALGLGFAAHEARVLVHARLLSRPRWPSHLLPARTAAAGAAGAVVLALLAVSAQPVAAQELRQQPGWTAIPGPWHAAATAIDALPAGSRVLVVPASGMALQVWGWTIDEPLQTLTTTAWASRGQAPLVPGGTVRWLDSIESLLDTGVGTPALSEALARAGFTDVLLRTDLDPAASDAPTPTVVESTLAASAGLHLVRSFGRPPGATLPLQLWSVDAAQGRAHRVLVRPESQVRTVQGGPEAVPGLLRAGLIGPDQPVELVGQNASAAGVPDILTDTLQRREQAFSRVNENVSSIMTRTQPWSTTRAAHTYPAFPGEKETVAVYPGMAAVTATSSGAEVDILGPVRPAEGPYSALDGDRSTAWVSAPFTQPVGQGIGVRLRAPVRLGSVAVTLWHGPGAPVVTALRLSTGSGSTVAPVPSGANSVSIPAPAGATRWVGVSVAGVLGHPAYGQVGFASVTLPGVDQTRTLRVPGRAGPDTTMLFSSSAPQRACTYPGRVCDAADAQPAEEAAALDRTFDVTGGGTWSLRMRAVAVPSAATARLLQPLQKGFSVRGSSILAHDPVAAPVFALDGNRATSWIAAPTDLTPRLSINWPHPRTLRRVQVDADGQQGTRAPTEVRIQSGGQVRTVSLAAGQLGFFAPLRTDHVTLTFASGSLAHPIGDGVPLAVSELRLSGLGLTYAPDPHATTGEPCGFGPSVTIDGVAYQTRVRGTLGHVLSGAPLRVRLCGPGSDDGVVALGPGEHRIRITSTARFQAVRAILTPAGSAPPAGAPAGADGAAGVGRSVRVTSWADTSRSLTVGAGPASVVWIPENANPGWVATAHGSTLTPVTIDGWAQGWQLPPGGPVTVQLRFAPQRGYVAAIVVGGLLLLGLVVLTALLTLRERRSPTRLPAARAGRGMSKRWGLAVAWGAVAGAACLAGGGLAIGALAGSLPVLRRLPVRPALVVIGLVVSAWWQHGPAPATGPDLLAACTVGLVLAPGLPVRWHRTDSGGADSSGSG